MRYLMSAKWWNVAIVFISAVYVTGCSKDGGSGSGSDPYGQRQIDVSDFKNTATADEVRSQGKEVGGYFKELGSVKGSFIASGAGNGFHKLAASLAKFETAEVCQAEQTTEEEQPNGEIWIVKTQDCTSEEPDGSKKFCTKTEKYTLNGNLVSTARMCSSSHSTHQGGETAGDMDSPFMPNFGDVNDCASAFSSFEQTYAGIKAEFDNVYGMLVSPNGLRLSGANLTDDGELQLAEPDDQSALAYTLVGPNQAGVEMKGSISGGANGSIMLIRQNVEVSMNMGMPQIDINLPDGEPTTEPMMPQGGGKMSMRNAESIAVDTSLKLIEMDIDSTTNMEMPEGGAMAMATKGRVAVSAGDEKFVTMVMDLSSGDGQQAGVARIQTETRLVAANRLSYKTTMSGTGSAGSGQLSFDVIRNGNKCEVTNMTSTVPGMTATR